MAIQSKLIKDSPLLTKFYEQAKELCEFTQEEKLSQAQCHELEKLIEENFKDQTINLFNSNTKEIDNRYQETTLKDIVDRTFKEDLIVAGNGTLFKTERSGGLNAMGAFVEFLLDTRSKVKKEMKAAMREGNANEAEKLDLRQKVFKVLTNAFYGSLGQSSFIFYDLNTAPSITQTGFNLISNLIISFEQFFSNNFYFREYGDILEYLDKICSKTYNFEVFVDNLKDYSVDRIYERLKQNYSPDLKYDLEMEETIKEKLESIAEKDRSLLFRIYYANNFYEFLALPEITSMLKDCLQYNIPSGNPGDIKDEKIKSSLMDLWEAIEDFVLCDLIFEEQLKFIEERKKKTVILTDTDSTFTYFGPLLDYCKSLGYDTEKFENFVTVSSVFFFILSHLSHYTLMKWADRLNIEEDKRYHIDLKNEFVYKRVFLTDNKKQYAGYLISREGILVEGKKCLDLKGMSIKKSSVNKISRKYFQDLLKDDILMSEKIDIASILMKLSEYEESIKVSLSNGETEYGIPKKFSGLDAYEFPYRMEVVRGTIVWNQFFPNEPMQLMDMTKTFPTLGATPEEFDRALKYWNGKISEEDMELISKLKDYVFFKNKDLAKTGFTRICIPPAVKKIPSFFIPFIDQRSLVFKNISNATILLKSLGIYCIEARSKSKVSNIIKF